MTASDLIRRLHEHKRWATRRILEFARQLSEAELLQPFDIGQGTVWQSLTHLLAADYVWLETLLGNERPVMPGDLPEKIPGNQLGTKPIASYSELDLRWHELDARWRDYLAQLTDQSLDDIVFKVSTFSGQRKRLGTRRADILLHLCTHAQYTTAQIVNMLRKLGHQALPDVMLITLARSEADCETDRA